MSMPRSQGFRLKARLQMAELEKQRDEALEALVILVAGVEILGVGVAIQPAYEMARDVIAKAKIRAREMAQAGAVT